MFVPWVEARYITAPDAVIAFMVMFKNFLLFFLSANFRKRCFKTM